MAVRLVEAGYLRELPGEFKNHLTRHFCSVLVVDTRKKGFQNSS
jgi:hypothetical protein